MKITVSAPGKIHLLGEHAVVYGKPAILTAIDKRLYVTIRHPERSEAESRDLVKSRSAGQSVNMRPDVTSGLDSSLTLGMTQGISPEKDSLVWEIIEVFKKAFTIKKLPPLEITITSQIPTGSGLGSSAALSAALTGALMKFVKNIWNPEKINKLTYEVEKIAHGNPSGADNTTVVFGGLVWYRREFEFLKSIWSLPIASYKIPKFAIIDSGRPNESTKQMVNQVADYYGKNKKRAEEIFSDQETQTKNLLLALKTNNKGKMISAIRQGERNLEKIGAAGNFARKIIREIESVGGAAKICGAGGRKKGSGILLCFHQDLTKIKIIADAHKVNTSPIKLGEEGIRLENIN